MSKSNFALRLQPSLLAEARQLAEVEGVALNRLIYVAEAEKVSALRTDSLCGFSPRHFASSSAPVLPSPLKDGAMPDTKRKRQ